MFAQARSLCVDRSEANLRSGPSSRSAITWTVGRNMPLKEIRRQGAWVEVSDLEGKRHWVHRGSVSTRLRCLVITRNFTTIRQGPGREYPPAELPVTDKYFPYRDIGGEDGWTQIEDDQGYRGWVPLTHTWKPTSYMHINLEDE